MTRDHPLPPATAEEEISALIDVLHSTERRLELLTAGEVDTVANRQGGTITLQRAQDQLRVSNAVRQSAILNALPAHIALLDTEGRIVAVNDAWRLFTCADLGAMHGAPQPIGMDYLDICDRAQGPAVTESRLFAGGVRSVLDGSAASHSIEYPCHSRTAQRWFLVSVTPLADDPSTGAVVMRMDISERKRDEETLRGFRSAMDETADAIVLVSRRSLCCIEVNATACRMFGYTRDELLRMGPADLTGNTLQHLADDYDDLIAGRDLQQRLETRIRRKNGTLLDVEIHRHAQRGGGDWIIVGVVRDITERKLTEDIRKNRVAELERFRRLSVGRELQMIDLKKQINEMAMQAGRAAPYDLAFLGPDTSTTRRDHAQSS